MTGVWMEEEGAPCDSMLIGTLWAESQNLIQSGSDEKECWLAYLTGSLMPSSGMAGSGGSIL